MKEKRELNKKYLAQSGYAKRKLDLFSSLRRLSDEEVEERFGEGRSQSGLGFQLQMSSEGRLFLTR